jgi:hypothetical protein
MGVIWKTKENAVNNKYTGKPTYLGHHLATPFDAMLLLLTLIRPEKSATRPDKRDLNDKVNFLLVDSLLFLHPSTLDCTLYAIVAVMSLKKCRQAYRKIC